MRAAWVFLFVVAVGVAVVVVTGLVVVVCTEHRFRQHRLTFGREQQQEHPVISLFSRGQVP